VATGIGSAVAEARPAAPQDRNRLSEKLANLATLPGVPVDLDHPSPVLTEKEQVQRPPLWRASGNVTIEKRQAQANAPMPAPLEPKPAPQVPPRPFRPAPPSAIKRPVRRMPKVEELPLVAQKEIKAKTGQAPAIGLEAQKKKVGFFERLASVGRSFAESDEEMPAKREPAFDRPWGELPKVNRAEPPQADDEQDDEPRGLRIDRPRTDKPLVVKPRLVEVKTASAAAEDVEMADESLVDDDLEIPAFLRRRAN
jgi:cell division protein FtsZ